MERQDYYEEELNEEAEGEQQDNYAEEQELEDSQTSEPDEEETEAPAPHEYEEEESEEEESAEPVKKPKSRPSGNARIQQITREKFQLLNELQRIRQENEAIRREAESARSQADAYGGLALQASDSSATLKLEKAKDKKRMALEEGDVQAQIDADVEIANAALEIRKINEYKSNEAFREKRARELEAQQSQAYNQPQEPVFDPHAAAEWQTRNTWYNPQSPDFIPELRQITDNYAAELENYLHREGRADLIGTREFLNDIDNHVQSVVQQAQQQGGNMSNRKQIGMRPVRGGVSPVRNTASSQQAARRRQESKLSNEEREVARMLGVKEDAYKREKELSMRENPDFWNGTNKIGGRF